MKCPWAQCRDGCVDPHHRVIHNANVALSKFVHSGAASATDIHDVTFALMKGDRAIAHARKEST